LMSDDRGESMDVVSFSERPPPEELGEYDEPIPFLVFDDHHGWIVAFWDEGYLRPYSKACSFLATPNGSEVSLDHVRVWCRLPDRPSADTRA
jgi:hypothetical protein